MTGSGGVGAAFGFRYQYLLTVEVLLDLYARGSTDWSVDVDPVSQDSADIVVHLTPSRPPESVLQVKASLPDSSTTIGVKAVQQILDGLRREHPAARRREVITNRTQTTQLAKELANPNSQLLKAGEHFVQRKESSQQLTAKLLHTIGNLRAVGAGGTGCELHYLLLRQLVDRVHEASARAHDQSLVHEDVRAILEGANPLLSSALGARAWGKCIQVPTGDFIERQESTRFLETHLPASSLYEGTPRIAVLKGLSGTGKSATACLHARSLLEHVAFVLWLDASSAAVLESQVPIVLDQLGARITPSNTPAQDLVEVLSGLPVPWALVLDGASTLAEVDPWVPRSGYGQVLLTTSVTNWPESFAPAMTMDAFCEIEARLFVARRLGRPVELWSTEQLSACDSMSRSLAGWPLALELAIGWITRHGGSIAAMQQFAERIDRLDLDNETLLPHGYPRTAAHVVLSQWRELSPEAQSLASLLLVMGGSRVPSRLLLDLVARQGMAAAALEELLASAFIRQEIVASGQPHDLDEVVTIHGFVQLVMGKQGVALNGPTVWALISTSDEWVRQLTERGHFREGALLLRPVDHLLKQLVEMFKEQPEVLVLLSMPMHNLAQLAFITSQASTARLWSRVAFNVRQDSPELVRDRSIWVQMQLQTLSLVAITAARLYKFEDLVEVGLLVDSLLQQGDPHALSDPATTHSLRMLRDVLHSCLPASSPPHLARDVMRQLNILVPQDAPEPPTGGAGNALISMLQIETATALHLMEHSAWQAGVDTALGAANQALEQGALVAHMVDGLLDVGGKLMIEAAKRPLETPELLINSVKRLVLWLDDNSAALDSDQQSRYSILSAFVAEDPETLPDAVRTLPPPEERTPQLEAWATLATILNEQRAATRRRSIFADPPPSLYVTHSIDGGDQLNVWWRHTESSALELWVHSPGIITISSLGQTDPVREGMARAGLREVTQEEPPQPAHGWSVRLNGGGIEITDADETSWVSIDHIPEDIARRIGAHGGLALIYGDLALTLPTDRRLSGWVPWPATTTSRITILTMIPRTV